MLHVHVVELGGVTFIKTKLKFNKQMTMFLQF
jgi:hypothetical protein